MPRDSEGEKARDSQGYAGYSEHETSFHPRGRRFEING